MAWVRQRYLRSRALQKTGGVNAAVFISGFFSAYIQPGELKTFFCLQ